MEGGFSRSREVQHRREIAERRTRLHRAFPARIEDAEACDQLRLVFLPYGRRFTAYLLRSAGILHAGLPVAPPAISTARPVPG